MSAILQLKKDIQLLNSQLDEVKKLNEYIKINSKEIKELKENVKEIIKFIHNLCNKSQSKAYENFQL